MREKPNLEDVAKSYNWLGHEPFYTELFGKHKDYRPGRENYEWNFKHKAFPKIAYARNEKDVIEFVKKYEGSHILCYGLNPRPKIFKNAKGFPRAAYEKEIEKSQNMILDFDFVDKKYVDEKLASLEIHFQQFDEYFLDLGLQFPPVRAFTGQGYHLLFAYPAIKVIENPEIALRIRKFQDNFHGEFKKILNDLGVKLDRVYDLRRMDKIYGTAKPDVGVLSCFFGEERKEDEKLRTHLLQLNMEEEVKEETLETKVSQELPKLFVSLLERDSRLNDLWNGKGKQEDQDTSNSGYDFSVAKHLLNLGYANLDDLYQILSARPNGAVKQSGKGDYYIRRTISNAILK